MGEEQESLIGDSVAIYRYADTYQLAVHWLHYVSSVAVDSPVMIPALIPSGSSEDDVPLREQMRGRGEAW